MSKLILDHEGRKYLRRVYNLNGCGWADIDVYEVIVAFGVTCPGRQQAIKKLLCAGQRGKGSELEDLIGADAALSRAIDIQRRKEQQEKEDKEFEEHWKEEHKINQEMGESSDE